MRSLFFIACEHQQEVRLLFGVEDDSVVLLLEPLHGVLLDELLRESDDAGLAPAVGDVGAGAAEHHVEVHAVDADRRVVLDAQVDVLLDAEPEVAVVGEVLAAQLVLADLKRGGIQISACDRCDKLAIAVMLAERRYL